MSRAPDNIATVCRVVLAIARCFLPTALIVLTVVLRDSLADKFRLKPINLRFRRGVL